MKDKETVPTYISSHLRTSFCVRVEEMCGTNFEQQSLLSLGSEPSGKSVSICSMCLSFLNWLLRVCELQANLLSSALNLFANTYNVMLLSSKRCWNLLARMHLCGKRNLPGLVDWQAFLFSTSVVAVVAVLVAGLAWLERFVNEARVI